jgi:hypothetical protein
MDHPLPWLRLVEAKDLDDSVIDFKNLKVRNEAGEKLGKVDGFVIDVDTVRPYYVVVDAGGWFKSRDFLLPIGHAEMDEGKDAIVTDLERERVNRFPGFNKGEFEKLKESDLQKISEDISLACGFTDVTVAVWERPTYRLPDWWRPDYYRSERADASAAARNRPATQSASRQPATASAATSSSTMDNRDRAVAHGGESSPFPGGRAEPGDVLGLETGGEQTHLGDTKESENERRREAEIEASKKLRRD